MLTCGCRVVILSWKDRYAFRLAIMSCETHAPRGCRRRDARIYRKLFDRRRKNQGGY